jgi:hypothetical protein
MTMSVRATRGDAVFHVGTETWCALAEICLSVAPDICASCKHWYTNDGDGLDADRANKLADRLEVKLSDGTVDRFIAQKVAHANSLPDEPCPYCGGTGIRRDAVGIKLGFDKRKIDETGHPRLGQEGWCNGCRGQGVKRPYKAHYPLWVKDREIVVDLVSFLKASGGFRIW